MRSRPRQALRRAFRTLTFGAGLLAAGCAWWRPTTVPLRTVTAPAGCPTRPDTLLVLLPGSWSLPEDFEREGFVAAARARRLAVDLMLVDAQTGYYRERSIGLRLHADVIEPARAQGYRHIWIGGISIGGFGALIHDQMYPADVDGIIAIAPFLGSPQIAEQVDAAGGLASWQPPAVVSAAGDAETLDLRLWRGLRDQTGAGRSPPPKPLILAYGLTDRFAANDRVLAAALPSSAVYTAEGGHDWPVWKVLWDQILPALPLPVDSRCGGP